MNKLSLNWIAGIYVLTLPILLFLTIDSTIPRVMVESISIVIAFFLVLITSRFKPWLLFFMAYILTNRLLVSESLIIAAYDFSAVGLLLYFTKFKLPKPALDNLVLTLAIMEFTFGLYNYSIGNLVDGGRVSGFFPSSMHYAFATAGLAFANYLSQQGWRRLLILFFLIGSAILSGARAATFCVLITMVLVMIEYFGVAKTILFIFLILLSSLSFISDFRALSYVEASDQTRLDTYFDWLYRIDWGDLLHGKGRYFLGSIGVVNNADSSLVTESSVLTFIEAYGVVGAVIFILAPLIKILKSPISINTMLLGGCFFLIALISPFFETPSILLANTIIINSAVYYKKRTYGRAFAQDKAVFMRLIISRICNGSK